MFHVFIDPTLNKILVTTYLLPVRSCGRPLPRTSLEDYIYGRIIPLVAEDIAMAIL